MLNVFKRSHREQPTAEMARALADEGLPPGMDPTTCASSSSRGPTRADE